MSCRSPCTSANGKYVYTFVNQSASLQNAIRICGQGRTLANNLSRSDYRDINSCCSSQKDYRIGLVADETCRRKSKPYYWVGSNDQCVSDGPLNLQQAQRNGCQTATITAGSPGSNIYTARWNNCEERLPYVCQEIKTISTTEEATSTGSSAESISTNQAKIFLPATTSVNQLPNGNTSLSRNAPDQRSDSNASQAQAVTTSINSAAIVGAVLGTVLILLLVVILILFRRSRKYEAVKQRFEQKTSSCFPRSIKNNENSLDAAYCQ